MTKIRPLKIKTNSKTFKQHNKTLNNIWVPNERYKKSNRTNNKSKKLVDDIFAHIKSNKTEVIKIMLPSLNNKKILDNIHKLVGMDKRFYILLTEETYKKNKKDLKSLAGKILMRFTDSEIPLLILAGSEKGLLKLGPDVYIPLEQEQVDEAEQWFYWYFVEEASFEIADKSQIDKPKKEGLSPPFYPICPSFAESFKFVNDVEEEEYIPSHALVSHQQIIDLIEEEVPDKIILNGIGEYNYSHMSYKNLFGTKDSNKLPSFIWYRIGILALNKYGDRWLKLWCKDGQKEDLEYLRDVKENSHEFVKSISLKDIESNSDVFLENTWNTVKEREEIEVDPIMLETIIPYNKLENHEPTFPSKPMLTKEVTFLWEIHPPYLPSDAKKHDLYEDWDKYEKKIKELIDEYNVQVKQAIKKSDSNTGILKSIKDTLSGKRSKAENYLSELEKHGSHDWKVDNSKEKSLKDLFLNIDDLWDDLEKTIKTEERRLEEEKQKREYDKKKTKYKEELQEINKKLKELGEDDENQRKKLDNKKGDLENKIAAPFKFKPPKNLYTKTKNKKKKSQIDYYRSNDKSLPEKPDLPLPLHGVLFKNKQKNFLVISDWGKVTKAKKEAKKYDDAKVVSYPNKGV